jgi:phosphoglycolate phosphatase-like HAD superfamily hydrolase
VVDNCPVRGDEAAALVLWDVDHTLIENSGVAKLVYAAAYGLVAGRPPATRPVTDGRTDGEIIRGMLVANGLAVTTDHEARLFAALRQAMDAHTTVLAERGYALPGTAEAITALDDIPGVVQSVLSGNIAYNARAKLAPFGLDRLLDLDIGGYGDDHADRHMLVAVAQHKAATKYRRAFTAANTLLIGDTPRDAQAGRDGGALVLGVATGIFSEQELIDAGVQRALPDLKDTARVLAACRALLGL